MDSSKAFDLIERISSLLRSEIRTTGMDYDLQPIQLNVLHFLTQSNRYSDTLLGVTEYFGLTKGTLSQTVKALESKGLIKKVTDKQDGRVTHLHVTRQGKKLVETLLPPQKAQKTWEILTEKNQAQLIEGLQEFLQTMQETNGMKSFGVCQTCRFNTKRGEGKFFCELTQENLSETDVTLLCREYQTPENETAKS